MPLSIVTWILAGLGKHRLKCGWKKAIGMRDSLGNYFDLHRMAITREAHLHNSFQLPLVKENNAISEGEANNSYFTSQLLISTYIIDLPQAHINNFFFPPYLLLSSPLTGNTETLLPQYHIFNTSSLTWTINIIKFILLGCPSLLLRTKGIKVSWHLCQTSSTLQTWERKLWTPGHYFLMESVNNHSRPWRATSQKINMSGRQEEEKNPLVWFLHWLCKNLHLIREELCLKPLITKTITKWKSSLASSHP